jgi:hypothetical protein
MRLAIAAARPASSMPRGHGFDVCGAELLPRRGSVDLAGEAKLSEANFVNGPKTLPIRYALA